MGLFSGLFSAGPKQLTTTQTSEPWGPLSGYLQGLYGQANSMAPQQYYPNQTVAGVTGAQEQGWQGMLDAAGQYGEQIQTPAQNSWMNMLGAADVSNNPAVQGLLDRNTNQVTKALTQKWLPQIDATSVAYGDYGGSGMGKAQQAALDTATGNLADANAGVLSNAYGQGLQAQQAAINQAPMIGNLGFMAPKVQQEVGSQQQAQQQALIDAEIARWNFGQQAPWDLMNMQNAIYSSGLGFGKQTGIQDNPNRRSPFMDFLGLGVAGASMFNKSKNPAG